MGISRMLERRFPKIALKWISMERRKRRRSRKIRSDGVKKVMSQKTSQRQITKITYNGGRV